MTERRGATPLYPLCRPYFSIKGAKMQNFIIIALLISKALSFIAIYALNTKIKELKSKE